MKKIFSTTMQAKAYYNGDYYNTTMSKKINKTTGRYEKRYTITNLRDGEICDVPHGHFRAFSQFIIEDFCVETIFSGFRIKNKIIKFIPRERSGMLQRLIDSGEVHA